MTPDFDAIVSSAGNWCECGLPRAVCYHDQQPSAMHTDTYNPDGLAGHDKEYLEVQTIGGAITMQGKRRDLPEDEYNLEPGEYGQNPDGLWFCCPPIDGYGIGGINKHTITQHEDGTITVSPSILFYDRDGKPGWHGYLTRGVWEEV